MYVADSLNVSVSDLVRVSSDEKVPLRVSEAVWLCVALAEEVGATVGVWLSDNVSEAVNVWVGSSETVTVREALREFVAEIRSDSEKDAVAGYVCVELRDGDSVGVLLLEAVRTTLGEPVSDNVEVGDGVTEEVGSSVIDDVYVSVEVNVDEAEKLEES